MRTKQLGALLALLGAAYAAPAAAASCAGTTSWIAGTTELCEGRVVYRDYVYDDHGAATGFYSAPPPYAAFSPGAPFAYVSAGQARYPTGAENTADLVRLELSLQGGAVAAEFELNTLYRNNQTIAAIAVDTDNNTATGTQKLLGLTVRGADAVYTFSAGDAATNLIHGSFPLPAAATWRVWAVTAQADGTVMNVAFRGRDTASLGAGGIPPAAGLAWDDRQAAALKDKDISMFAATIATADMTGGVTRRPAVHSGFFQRVYTSAYTLPPGEGIDTSGVPGRHGATDTPCEQYFNFLGKYQPYAIYIPAKADPHGLQIRMHGCTAHPASEVNQRNYQVRFGENLNLVIASPLGRGPNGFYSDISERDVLDVMDDVIANYAIDQDRVFAAGTSMGGYGALRFASLYPDRFAGATNWVGFPGNFFNNPATGAELGALLDQLNATAGGFIPAQSNVGAIGNMMDYTGNLLHVPSVHLYSTEDELVHVTSSLAYGLQLKATEGLEFDFYEHAPAEHLSFVVFDDWQKESRYLRGRTLVHDPGHIVFRTDAYLDYPEYGIRHDKAYWASDIRARTVGTAEGQAYSDLNLRSYGCGGTEKRVTAGQDVGYDPVFWVRLFNRRLANDRVLPTQNRLVAMLKNVASVTIDTTASCLSPGATYEVKSDGPVVLNFSDGRVLSLGAGTHSGTF